jgi:site-specific DNA recombinase
MAERPDGRKLMKAASRHEFDEVWLYKVDRLGRDEIDPLIVWRELEALGIKVHSVTEGISDAFIYSIHVAMAAKERRTFLERSAAGMERIVKNGHFPGGICPLGYEVSGQKNEARIFPSKRIIWGGWTAADLIVQIYQWLGVDGWSCPRIANHLNALGVPTAYQHIAPGERRAERGTGLQAKWRAGRIRNMVVLSVYKGLYRYGKRSKKQRETWEAKVPRLVDDDLWQAAQEALARNRLIAKNTPRRYLLTGLIKCGDCGKSYCATHGRDEIVWWRCNGKMTTRYDTEDRCQSKAVKSTEIELLIWQDIERWLRKPGELLKELAADQGKGNAMAEAETISLEAQLMKLEQEKRGYHRQNAQGLLSDAELRDYIKEYAEKRAAVERRLSELKPHGEAPEPMPLDLHEELKRRLDADLSEEQRQEIARLLIKSITIRTINEDGNRRCIAEVTYRFSGVVNSCTDRDS